jgi:hypothetical protein
MLRQSKTTTLACRIKSKLRTLKVTIAKPIRVGFLVLAGLDLKKGGLEPEFTHRSGCRPTSEFTG